jgi:small-conductance mechanosensitive channel
MKYLARALLCLCLLVVLPVLPVVAQNASTSSIAYEDWERTATRAEDVLESAVASNEAFDALRAQLVEWRDRFTAGQTANADRIQTLNDQIAALGEAPAEGATEDSEIATLRATLAEQLQVARAPARQAEAAFTRADGLIRELDTIIRDRRTSQRLRLDPSPVNPVNWGSGFTALDAVGNAVSEEVSTNFASVGRQKVFRDGLPITLVLIAIAMVLILRSGAWTERFLSYLKRDRVEGRPRFRVGTFIASLLGVALPVLGIFALIAAADRSNLTGIVGDVLLAGLAAIIASIAAARWLSRQIFPKAYPPRALLDVSETQGREARFYAVILAILIALSSVVQELAGTSKLATSMSFAAQSVLSFPIIVFAGLMLFRLGQILIAAARAARLAADATDVPPEEQTPSGLVTMTLGRIAMFVGLASPALAAVGYGTAGAYLVFSCALTLALLGLVAVLQRLVRDLYAMIMRDEAKAAGLIPVLIGFAIAIAALPFLALIWGARTADLTEAWGYISNGVQLGDSRISPMDFLIFAVIFTIGYLLTRLVQGALKTQVLPKTKMDVGGRNAIVSGTGYLGIFLAALIAITGAGIDLSSLAIVAGALSVGIGFGLQTIVSNFVSGIILLIERPISEGDMVEVGPTMGIVRDISVRATRIETFDRTDVIVPNADLIAGPVTNWTKGNLTGRLILPVGVAYGSDTQKIQAMLQEIIEAHPLVILNPPPSVLFMRFGADSLDFEIRAILRDVNYKLSTQSELNHEIARRFEQENIEVPFAQRDIWIRNPEELLPGKPKPLKKGTGDDESEA